MEPLNHKLAVPQPAGAHFGKTSGVCGKLRWHPAFGTRRTAAFARAQRKLDTHAVLALEAYMPMDTGRMIATLRQNTRPGSGRLVVDTPYAATVYYGKAISGKNGPLRGPYYFNRMAADHAAALRRIAAEEMGAKE